jgi:NADP-dependent aldehyde dehydrogenase
VFVPQRSRLEAALAAAELPPAQTMLTESIASGFSSGVERLLEVPGVEVVAGSARGSLVVAAPASALAAHADELLGEVFGPVTVLLRYGSSEELLDALDTLEGSLTATVHSEESDDLGRVLERLSRVAGRVLFDGWPTGVAVTWSQHHGGPWPSTTSQFTSVGATAVRRFLRPIAYQDAPERALPLELREQNPLGIPRRVDGVLILPA